MNSVSLVPICKIHFFFIIPEKYGLFTILTYKLNDGTFKEFVNSKPYVPCDPLITELCLEMYYKGINTMYHQSPIKYNVLR